MDIHHLESAVQSGELNESTAVGALAGAALSINREMHKAIANTNVPIDSSRFEDMVNRFKQATQFVAVITRAKTYTVTVGFPAGVSASLEWDGPH